MINFAELLMDIGKFLIYFGVGLFIGYLIFNAWLYYTIKKFQNQLEQRLGEVLESRNIKMFVEEVDNMLFCYNADTKEFICQGKDFNEITELFKQRFPGYGAWLVDTDVAIAEKLVAQKNNNA